MGGQKTGHDDQDAARDEDAYSGQGFQKGYEPDQQIVGSPRREPSESLLEP
jgi:hypothetical protein